MESGMFLSSTTKSMLTVFTFQRKFKKHDLIICGNYDCGRAGNFYGFFQLLAI